jgi:hypothetical protein
VGYAIQFSGSLCGICLFWAGRGSQRQERGAPMLGPTPGPNTGHTANGSGPASVRIAGKRVKGKRRSRERGARGCAACGDSLALRGALLDAKPFGIVRRCGSLTSKRSSNAALDLSIVRQRDGAGDDRTCSSDQATDNRQLPWFRSRTIHWQLLPPAHTASRTAAARQGAMDHPDSRDILPCSSLPHSRILSCRSRSGREAGAARRGAIPNDRGLPP